MKKIFRYILYILFRPIWILELLIPRSKKIWIFGAWYGNKYSDNSKYLYEYCLSQTNLRVFWITKSKTIYNQLKKEKKPVFLANSIGGIFYTLRAKYCFLSSTQLDVNMFCLNGCEQIWLWHGMPLKKILKSEHFVVNRLRDILNPYEAFHPSYTLTSSDFFTPFLSEAFSLSDDKILSLGLPRCDALFSNLMEPRILEIRDKYPDCKIYLYMPTFRMTKKGCDKPFNPFQTSFGFDEEFFIDFLEKNNIIFLYKPHYVDEDIVVYIDTERFIRLSDKDYEDLYILLNSVDCLLTDYSSVYFDFLSCGKPIYLLTFDYEEYRKKSRDVYFDLYMEMKAEKFDNWKQFLLCDKKNEINLIADRKKFASNLDGNSCKKIVEYFTNNGDKK